MPTIDLSDDEIAALISAVRQTINEARFPHSPRLAALKSVLDKLEPRRVTAAVARPPLPSASRTKTRR